MVSEPPGKVGLSRTIPSARGSTVDRPVPHVIASFFTIAGDTQLEFVGGTEVSPFDLRERIEVAARGGFSGIGFGDKDLGFWLTRYPLPLIRTLLADNGIGTVEIETIFDWFTEGDRRIASDEHTKVILGWAAELGALHVKATTDLSGAHFEHDHLVSEWAKLCAEAAEAGTRVALEPMPPATIKTPAQGLSVLKEAGAHNAGLMLDIWHVHRAGVPFDELRAIPPEWIAGVELGDAYTHPVNGDLVHDGLNHRLLPGTGELDVTGFIRAVLAAGYRGAFGSEIFSIENRARSLEEAVEANYSAAAAALAKATG